MEYLDLDGEGLRKGFYFYSPTNIYDEEEIKTPVSIYYFTGKFEDGGDPIFKTLVSFEDVTKVLSRSSCRYLRLISDDQMRGKIDEVQGKIESLEKELNWYKKNLSDI